MTHPQPQTFRRVCQAVAASWPPERFADVTTIAAISGGADSVGLLRVLDHLRPPSAKGRLVVAHYNHRLRAEASEADERFVADLARRLHWDCEIQRAPHDPSVPLDRHGTVGEASLRAARYDFLTTAAHRCGARYVVTAHTADDNVETLLHNLFRGTGPAGLTGIAPFRDLGAEAVLVRPLLNIDRSAIRRALEEIDQPWREDLSNADPRWQRNWLRGFLLPEIRQRYPHADRAVQRLLSQQSEVMEVLRRDAAEWSARQIVASPAGTLCVQITPTPVPRPVVVAALRDAWDARRWPRGAMAERHWQWLADAVTGLGGSRGTATIDLPGGLRAKVRDGASVVVEALRGD